jgi:hypothetical protein
MNLKINDYQIKRQIEHLKKALSFENAATDRGKLFCFAV